MTSAEKTAFQAFLQDVPAMAVAGADTTLLDGLAVGQPRSNDQRIALLAYILDSVIEDVTATE